MIIVDPVMDRYTVGLLLILRCVVTLSSAVNTPLTLETVWRREGAVLTTNNQLTVREFSTTDDRVYTSSLEFHPLTTNLIGNDTQYECEATVLPQNNSFVTETTVTNSTRFTVDGELKAGL